MGGIYCLFIAFVEHRERVCVHSFNATKNLAKKTHVGMKTQPFSNKWMAVHLTRRYNKNSERANWRIFLEQIRSAILLLHFACMFQMLSSTYMYHFNWPAC